MIINQFFAEKIIMTLGWTILHSLWQGLLTGFILLFVLLLLRDQSAKLKYNIAIALVMIFACISIFTFGYLFQHYEFNHSTALSLGNTVTSGITTVDPVEHEVIWDPASFTLNLLGLQRYLPFIVIFWGVGVLFLSLRFAGSLIYAQRLKLINTFPVQDYWQEQLCILAEKLHIRQRIRLLESAKVKIPVVIGFFKPVILMPLGYLSGLPQNQIEAILAHELAHISRKDYFVNILYSMISIVYFYHPVIWWMSFVIRKERENCCDDMAISVTGDHITLARALTSVYENQLSPVAVMALFRQKNMLYNRIKRLTRKASPELNPLGGLLISSLFFIGALILFVNARAQFISEKVVPSVPAPVVTPVDPYLSFTAESIQVYVDNGKIVNTVMYEPQFLAPVQVSIDPAQPLLPGDMIAEIMDVPEPPDVPEPVDTDYLFDYHIPFLPFSVPLDSLNNIFKYQQQILESSLPYFNNMVVPHDSIMVPVMPFYFDSSFLKIPNIPFKNFTIPDMPFWGFAQNNFDSVQFKVFRENFKNLHFNFDSTQFKHIQDLVNSFRVQFDSTKMNEMQKYFQNKYVHFDTTQLYKSLDKLREHQFDMEKFRQNQLQQMEKQREMLDRQIEKLHKEIEKEQKSVDKAEFNQQSLKAQNEQIELLERQLQKVELEIKKSEKEQKKSSKEQFNQQNIIMQKQEKELLEKRLQELKQEVERTEKEMSKQDSERKKSNKKLVIEK